MSNHRPSFYSRLKAENEIPQHIHPTREPLQHNLDVKKLRWRCCYSLSAALLIAFILWVFDPPAGHEAERDPENTDTQLKFVVVVHRHGARSALHNYTFEHGIEWEVPPGKLLDVGFQGGFRLGRKLRDNYWSPLTSIPDSSVKCFSSDVDRTVDTAHSVLLGLFADNATKPNEGNCTCRPKDKSRSTEQCVAECIGIKLVYIPKVKIWNEKSGEEAILRQTDYCESFRKHKEKFFKSEICKNASKDLFSEQFDYVEEIVGGPEVSEIKTDGSNETGHHLTMHDIDKIWDTAQCLSAQKGTKNGPYANPVDTTNQLLPLREWTWHHIFSSEIGPSAGGLLLNRIILNLKNGFKRKPPGSMRRGKFFSNSGDVMILYSAHDSTLAGLLAAMGVSDWHFPRFTSHIVFELFGPKDPTRKTALDNHYVRILFDDKLLTVGDCDQSFCYLNVFVDSMKDRVQEKKDCSRDP